jgi:diaminopimelate epimerase
MRFTKMHGAGNDYVYIDCFTEPYPADAAELARQVSDRHIGIGSDGLILICPSQVADARMRMFNSDGSESEMCGNGVRCVAKYVYDHGIARRTPLKIETGRGILVLELEIADGLVRRVRVDMGEPILEPAKIPVDLPHPFPDNRMIDFQMDKFMKIPTQNGILEPMGLDTRMTCVSMGNPHAVFFCENVSWIQLEICGPYFEHLPLFPQRTNVHFVQLKSKDEVIVHTWERGSGITQACGTGACAVCVAGVLTNRTRRNIVAHLPGGDLELEWNESNNHVYMTGEAVEVFSGEWNK